jgi:hypothetical protein
MKSSYSSTDDIRVDFGIAETELPEIRSRLRSMQGTIHPDKNEGAFASNEDKERFHQLNKAIDYIDSQAPGRDLVPISAVTDLTRAVTELVKAQSSSTYNRLSEQVSNSVEAYRSKFRIPKIALSAISAAIAAI